MLKKPARLCLLLGALAAPLLHAEEPALPSGLGADEPGLPSGLGGDEPALPGGLDSGDSGEPALPAFGSDSDGNLKPQPAPSLAQQLGITGFWEVRAGTRTRDPIEQRDTSLAETRLELEKDLEWQGWQGKLSADLLYDDVPDSQRIDLKTGDGWIDLREAWAMRRLGSVADIKLGRQILTWGVGDLLFINDLFPKDWNSFLAGRDEQYLKAPSDAMRLGIYSDTVNVNLVYTPRFDSDRYIDGRRLSYYSAAAGEVVGRNGIVEVDKPDRNFEDDELALRIYRNWASYEVALYGYNGYWKSPGGFDPASGLATFPRLRVLGASLRGPLGPGIASFETGYYDSRDDSDGSNPWINNSEWRGLLGYEWEIVKNTTLGLQYYVEALQDYRAYKDSLFPGQPARDEYRQLITARLTRLAMNQNLTLSLFGFYSPTDKDAYLRPKVSYKATDNWLLEGGFNLFSGDKPYTFFGQFESNSNAYLAVRYSFN